VKDGCKTFHVVLDEQQMLLLTTLLEWWSNINPEGALCLTKHFQKLLKEATL